MTLLPLLTTNPARGPKGLHQLVVLEDVERLLQRGEVVGADQDEGGSSVAGDQDAVVFALDPPRSWG